MKDAIIGLYLGIISIYLLMASFKMNANEVILTMGSVISLGFGSIFLFKSYKKKK